MSWIVFKTTQSTVTVVNNDLTATPTTDYHVADVMAHHSVAKGVRLTGKGYNSCGKAVRNYALV